MATTGADYCLGQRTCAVANVSACIHLSLNKVARVFGSRRVGATRAEKSGGTGGRSAAVVDGGIIDPTQALAANLTAVPLLSSRAPFVSSPAQGVGARAGTTAKPNC